MGKTKSLSYRVRKNVYIQIYMHPRFGNLDKRLQEIIVSLADGTGLQAIAKKKGYSRTLIWDLRNRALHKLGFTTIKYRKVRTMTMDEVREKLKIY